MAALDFPNNPTLNQQYAAPNGVTYQWDGVAWIVSGSAAVSLWTASGGTLLPTDATKTLSVPGGAAGAGLGQFLLGSNTAKARLQTNNTTAAPYLVFSTNRDAVVGTQDDATKPSWQMSMDSVNDGFYLGRQPAGGAYTGLLTLDTAGNLTLSGAACYLPNSCQLSQYISNGAPVIQVMANAAGGAGYVAAKPSWFTRCSADTDHFEVWRQGPNTGGYTTPLYVNGADGKTYCTLANSSVTLPMIAGGATYRTSAGTSFRYAAASNINSTSLVRILGTVSLTTSGGLCLICVNLDGRFYPGQTGVQFLVVEVQRSGTTVFDWIYEYEIPSGSLNHAFAVAVGAICEKPPAGTYTYDVYVRMTSTSQTYRTGSYNASNISVYEFA